METITTKKDEVIESITTANDLSRAAGKFFNRQVVKTWTEEFVEESIGEVVSVERNEVLYDKGTAVTPDIISQLLFYMQSGDVLQVEVSNQRRSAYEANYGAHIYLVVAEIGVKMKKNRFLFQAPSIPIALEILRDYIELNFTGGYRISSVKEFQTDIIIEDTLKTREEAIGDEETLDQDKFYQITVLIQDEDGFERKGNAVVKTTELEKALMLVDKRIRDKEPEEISFTTKLEEAKLITVDYIIEDEFLAAYSTKQ